MANFTTNLLSAVQSPTNLTNSLSSMIPGSFYTNIAIVSAVNFSRNVTLSSVYTANIGVGNNITTTTYNTITAATVTLSSFNGTANAFTGVSAVSTFFTAKQSNVPHVIINSIGTIGGKTVKGIAFNKVSDDVTSTTTPLCSVSLMLSAFSGNTFKVNSVYDLTEMAFILDDNSTSQFTCVTARGTAQQQLSANNFNGSYPEQRRKWNLNG